MGRFAMPVVAVIGAVAVAFAPSAAPRTAATPGPPSDLTAQGRAIWNLEALLRQTFGRRAVWLHYPRTYYRQPQNFAAVAAAGCCGGEYFFTFANPRGSRFTLRRPAHPPSTRIGAAGGEIPLTIRGAYISCGPGRWLFRHYGNGPANWKVNCLRG